MEKLEQDIKTAIGNTGVELYDIVTLKSNDHVILRVYITKQGGITLDQCTEITKLISPIIDLHDPIHGEYILEVSSPGIERKLKKPNHFKASIGELVKIKDFNKDILTGKLLSADNNEIKIETDHGEEIISYDEISTAATYFDW